MYVYFLLQKMLFFFFFHLFSSSIFFIRKPPKQLLKWEQSQNWYFTVQAVFDFSLWALVHATKAVVFY